MKDDIKRELLALLLLTAIVTVLIAAALPYLELTPGIPLPSLGTNSDSAAPDPVPLAPFSLNMLLAKAMLVVLIALTGISFGCALLKGDHWKVALRSALATMVLFALVMVVLFILLTLPGIRIAAEPLEAEFTQPALHLQGPPLGLPPLGLLLLVWIGLCACAVLLAVWLFYRRRSQFPDDPFRLEAERALRDLRAGVDYRNVVVRCYEQMSAELEKKRGIERQEAMTTRDFERLLQARGVSRAPVHQLTQLFEAARYGFRAPSLQDEQHALDCLNEIVERTPNENESN